MNKELEKQIKKHTTVFCNDCDKETRGKLIPQGKGFYIECSKCGGYDFDYVKHGLDSLKLKEKQSSVKITSNHGRVKIEY